MLRLSFISPAALGLLLLIPLLWWLALLAPRRLAPWRFWGSLLIRTVLLIALALALAGTQVILPIYDLTTVFLLDVSDSIAPTQRDRAIRYVNEAIQTMQPNDRAAIVVFGENALVERAPAHLAPLSQINSVPITSRTNLQDALQLGLALFPAETQKRLVLLSDGGENMGHAFEALQLAQLRGIPLDVVPIQGEHGPDVLISTLDVPGTAREGQDITVGVLISSSLATSGELQVFVDGRLTSEQPISLTEGTNDIALRVPAGEVGFRRIEVRIDAQGDSAPQNNRAAAFTEIQGPPHILLIASSPAHVANIQSVLSSSSIRVDVRTPSQAPADLTQLGVYEGVILVDTPARELPRAVMEAIPIYVRELGRGFAMIGGVESFGAGGYRRSPIEPILPVHLDPQDTSLKPELALVMVIDRSGSMSESSGGRTKLDLAKEAVYQASLALSQRDQIGLVVFDDAANWVLPIQQLPTAADIEQALSSFDEGGGTNIRPGIEQAAEALSNVDASIKHVILLTDGIADSNYGDIIDRMRAEGTTISTVAIGADANPHLEQIAARGNGRFYKVQRFDDVPRIFLQETVIVAGRDIVEGQFTPAIALPAPLVRGFDALPPLYGYNGTGIRAAARTILVSPDNKPILAQWQYGLGRTLAWTSDMKGQWARDWVGWAGFPRFVEGIVDALLPPRDQGELALETITSGGQSILDLTVQDQLGQPINNAAIAGRLVDPENQAQALKFAQVGMGRYRAIANTSLAGVYMAQVAVQNGEQSIGMITTGLVVSYSHEYGDRRENIALLQELAIQGNGRVAPAPAAVFESPQQQVGLVREIGAPLLWLALVLWPFDIGVRRLFLSVGLLIPQLAALNSRLRSSRAQSGTAQQTFGRLSAAKQRATRSYEQRTPAAATPQPPDASDSLITPPTETKTPTTPSPASPPDTQDRQEQIARLLAAKQRARQKRRE